jgi:two-component system sensor histidine kinase DctS
VLLNVIRNACEASIGATSRVVVKILGTESDVEVTVSDEGVGIDPSALSKIFDFGFSTKGTSGNGMGLWTVKHIVTKHQGRIDIESEQGKGTRVRLTWPRRILSAAS